jgi:hypothetical protein
MIKSHKNDHSWFESQNIIIICDLNRKSIVLLGSLFRETQLKNSELKCDRNAGGHNRDGEIRKMEILKKDI